RHEADLHRAAGAGHRGRGHRRAGGRDQPALGRLRGAGRRRGRRGDGRAGARRRGAGEVRRRLGRRDRPQRPRLPRLPGGEVSERDDSRARRPRVVLVGPPAAGKTTVGRLLADRLSVPFVDTDDLVVARAGKPVSDIFVDDGEEEFRRLEADAVVEALTRDAVVALGGGGDRHRRPHTRRGRRRGARRGDHAGPEVSPRVPVRIPVGGPAPYEVVVGDGLDGELAGLLGGAAQVALVHPAALAGRAAAVAETLRAAGLAVLPLPVPDGEAAKTLAVAGECWDALGAAGFTRSDAVVGLGGGATTDLAGWVAAAWLRGVRVVHLPTTLLGMVDAAVGGKTGIDVAAGKNLVGAFHPPAGVLCDLTALATLPPADYRAGLAEVVKCGFIADPAILDLLERDGVAAPA